MSTNPTPGHYAIDTARSQVTFRTRHLFGLAPVRGTVAVTAGTIEVAPASSRVRVELDAASFDTGNPRRDDDVRSARFLDAGRHPLLVFAADDLDGDVLAGTLTVRDVTRRVELTISESAWPAGSLSVRATARLDRVAFGLTAARGLAGRYLNLDIQVIAHV